MRAKMTAARRASSEECGFYSKGNKKAWLPQILILCQSLF